jgi:hypothetical protein
MQSLSEQQAHRNVSAPSGLLIDFARLFGLVALMQAQLTHTHLLPSRYP